MQSKSNQSITNISLRPNLKRKLTLTAAAAALLTTTGCETLQTAGDAVKNTFASSDPCSNNARNIGITAGGLLGAAAGIALGDNATGAIIGAGVGALFGALIGQDIDQRRCDLSKLAQQHQLQMEVVNLNVKEGDKETKQGLSVSIQNESQFQVGSSKLTKSGREAFEAIAQTYLQPIQGSTPEAQAQRHQKMRILLVGHTDDTGPSTTNARLSEERAKAVAEIFAKAGFKRSQIYYQGAGETLPVASNAEEAGRARNRRVEIIDLSDDVAFENFLSGGRRTNTAFYRPAEPQAQAPQSTASKKTQTARKSTSTPQATVTRKADTQTAPSPASTSVAKGSTAPAGAAAPATAAAEQSQKPQPARATNIKPGPIDFGGAPVNGQPMVLALGGTKSSGSTFPWMSVAHADETAPLLSCLQDRPRVAHGVKSLESGELRTKDYLPGVYNSSWVASVNGHLVALNRVAVLRDGVVPANKPELEIYRNYQGNAKAKPDFSGKPEVNAYLGERGLLYRVFNAGPVQCMDILIPHTNAKTAIAGNLIYPGQGDYYQTEIQPRLAK